jgi:riboflavin kinase/FMN adenylyltransferase
MFDGVHIGHQQLLACVVKEAKQLSTSSAVITFSNHPRLILQKPNDNPISLLQTNQERMKRLEQCGIDYVFTIDFSVQFSSLSPAAFLDLIVAKLNPVLMIMGYDNYFGRNTAAELDTILSKGFYRQMKIYRTDDCVYFKGLEVSSTQIRKALGSGDMPLANAMLGYSYTLCGKVIDGYKQGRSLGFPTANLSVNPLKLIPRKGVYATRVAIENQTLNGVVFIGERQTFALTDLTIEVHIFDFDNDIYNQDIELLLVDFIREEQRFASVQDLKNQIKHDCDEAKRILT